MNWHATIPSRIDPRVWPLLALGLMFGSGCTVLWTQFDARVVNESSRPIIVEYSGSVDGRDMERLTTQLAPGGAFERRLQGSIVQAAAMVRGPDAAKEPLEVEFSQALPECVVRDAEGGIALEQRLPAPKEKP